jgi:hypothetical protein
MPRGVFSFYITCVLSERLWLWWCYLCVLLFVAATTIPRQRTLSLQMEQVDADIPETDESFSSTASFSDDDQAESVVVHRGKVCGGIHQLYLENNRRRICLPDSMKRFEGEFVSNSRALSHLFTSTKQAGGFSNCISLSPRIVLTPRHGSKGNKKFYCHKTVTSHSATWRTRVENCNQELEREALPCDQRLWVDPQGTSHRPDYQFLKRRNSHEPTTHFLVPSTLMPQGQIAYIGRFGSWQGSAVSHLPKNQQQDALAAVSKFLPDTMSASIGEVALPFDDQDDFLASRMITNHGFCGAAGCVPGQRGTFVAMHLFGLPKYGLGMSVRRPEFAVDYATHVVPDIPLDSAQGPLVAAYLQDFRDKISHLPSALAFLTRFSKSAPKRKTNVGGLESKPAKRQKPPSPSQKQHANARTCSTCGKQANFSNNQLKKRGRGRCRACVLASVSGTHAQVMSSQ